MPGFLFIVAFGGDIAMLGTTIIQRWTTFQFP